ncbi:integrase catalytic domain-containing protein [Nephila pilipes]|uniref:Integrase catalytic domain-containing protein n=1 Tax=Nephila pilipes TaxID=299642 RepID=A0A8X6P453_NEPPI|nr:integrase catalytic domain-containing protein [Nephila pilipes]
MLGSSKCCLTKGPDKSVGPLLGNGEGWKTSADAPVKTYKLSSVTYETVSALFSATRNLKALADEERADFPDAADVISNDIYMDDVLSSM